MRREGRHPETFGQVVRVGKDAFSVQTGKGLLTIRELQLEGKKRMDTAAFYADIRWKRE